MTLSHQNKKNIFVDVWFLNGDCCPWSYNWGGGKVIYNSDLERGRVRDRASDLGPDDLEASRLHWGKIHISEIWGMQSCLKGVSWKYFYLHSWCCQKPKTPPCHLPVHTPVTSSYQCNQQIVSPVHLSSRSPSVIRNCPPTPQAASWLLSNSPLALPVSSPKAAWVIRWSCASPALHHHSGASMPGWWAPASSSSLVETRA